MPADYNIPMTDAQITQALQLMVERVSEGWAQETYDGSPVGSGSPYYHKSSKWWATQAADAAARAEAAVPAGTAGAVFFDRDMSSTLTASQKEQFRKNIMAGGSNKNLLDNPFFRINQRGGSSYSNGYSVDRWSVYNLTATIGDMDNGGAINLHRTDSGAGFFQRIPYDASLIGKQFTLSIMFDDGDIFSPALNMPSTGVTSSTTYRNVKLSLSTAETYHQFTIYIYTQPTDTDPSIKAAKLEYGSVSTLANDAAPNYAEELAKCQRYFQRIKCAGGTATFIAGDTAVSATSIFMTLHTNLRDAQTTVSYTGAALNDHASSKSITSMSVTGYGSGFVRLTIESSGLTAGKYYKLALALNAFIDLSADL